MNDRYRIIGPLYDVLAAVFSLGQIDRCKIAMHDYIRPGDKILFAGVGQGRDAIEAANRAGEVTVVDLSESMLNIFNRKIQGRSFPHQIRQAHSDILAFEEHDQYDMVFGNFFLNVFPPELEFEILGHLVKLAKPGGSVVVGDFSLPKGGAVSRLFQNIYWYIADTLFYIMAQNAFHPVYDYAAQMRQLGLEIMEVRTFRVFGDERYYSIRGRKLQ
ncbi:MAG TPA: class I SAM-dependent methyltransferase [Deltaproteobacteria bacterium]|nr:class I SAM-dependent methyltransferase [Deltaproteobacteria bacterium]